MNVQTDNITRDVMAAERLGYGCHYGRYKADHPHTKEDYEEFAAARDAKAGAGMQKACAECGSIFHAKCERNIYCCKECAKRVANRRRSERMKGREKP